MDNEPEMTPPGEASLAEPSVSSAPQGMNLQEIAFQPVIAANDLSTGFGEAEVPSLRLSGQRVLENLRSFER